MTPTLWLAQNEKADALLAKDPFALVMGMILDQQFPLERAFAAPYELRRRLGNKFSPKLIAGMELPELVAVFAAPPALHRFPSANAQRVRDAARIVMDEYHGDAASIWMTATTGDELVKRLRALPGFGAQKAAIFAALLAKQFDVKPHGWKQASAPYSGVKAMMSVADIVDETTWRKTREYKKAQKVKARAAKENAPS